MPDDSPFFLTKIECPVCKTINEFETVKVGSYLEDGRDTDFCPKNIQWRFPRYQSYNPLAFFTVTCSNCYYTREFSNAFRDWQKDNNFRTYRLKTIKERHLEELAAPDSIIKELANHMDLTRFPNETAIIKLHLAVFDELLNDRFKSLDLGRFYLRIGWVFRDMESGENPSNQTLKAILAEIDSKYRMIADSFTSCTERINVLASHIDAHFATEELSADMKSRMLPYRERFNARLDELATDVQQARQKYQDFDELLTEYKSETLGTDVAGRQTFGSYPSFTEFLLQARKRWDAIVTNEREALEKAVHYYKKAFTDGSGIAPGNQQIQVSYLIAELSRRIGDYDGAREYFNSTIKNGQAFVHQYRHDRSRTVLARKILELAIEQGRANLAALKAVS
jgi:uncharacterized protein (DUF2225 family)